MIATTIVPEPSTLALAALGAFGLLIAVRRRRLASLPNSVALVIYLAVLISWAPVVQAAVDMRPVPIHISVSGEFPELVFIAYPKGKLAAATIVLEGSGITFSPADTNNVNPVFVVALPKTLADKNDSQVDPAWLETPSADVTLVGSVDPQFAYSGVIVRYQIVNSGKGPGLKVLNPEELTAAQWSPAPSDHVTFEPKPQSMLSWILRVAGALVLACSAWFFWRIRKRNACLAAKTGLIEK